MLNVSDGIEELTLENNNNNTDKSPNDDNQIETITAGPSTMHDRDSEVSFQIDLIFSCIAYLIYKIL